MAPLLFINSFPSSLPSSNRPSISYRPPYACEASVAPTTADIDKLFSRLNHVNSNLRKKACAELSHIATPEIIERLVNLLDLDDTAHRRAAVQALGMTGVPVIPSILPLLCHSENSTVRASCSKVLAAVALYFPESRADFPNQALDALEIALEEDPDPVTKLATVGCLGTLGSDLKREDEVLPGNDRAVSILVDLCRKSGDMALGASAIGAISQIGQNGTPERRACVIEELNKVVNVGSGDEETGSNYVKEIAASHLEQLEGGIRAPDE